VTDCLFCAIAAGDIPAKIHSEDDRIVVFADVNPQAPTHLLVIPREHHDDFAALVAADPTLAVDVVAAATKAAEEAQLADGYRIVFNTGKQGGQSVRHVHAHLLGGRQLTWPPG
jgi:histidine triad (HIT) family protein